jgi:Spy/CpxP family protein refolding chaperone
MMIGGGTDRPRIRKERRMTLKHAARAMLMACMVSATSIAVAQPLEEGWHHGGGLEFLRGLDLTDSQKTQAHEIQKAAWTQSKPLFEQLHTLHEQQINLLLTAGSTEAQIAAVLKQEESVRAQLDSAHLATALQLRALLTPDQLAQAADLHSKLEALHQQEHDAIESARGGQP